MKQWLDGCNRVLPDGRAGCVLVRGAFAPLDHGAKQGVVLYLDAQGNTHADYVLLREGADISVRGVYDPVADRWPTLPGGTVALALDGAFEIRPTGGNALFIGGSVLMPGN